MRYPEIALGDIFNIARGGSPRPIERFITDDQDGVNWISISDASDSSKYITKAARKICPSGVSRSRRVVPGDFLLTNSMSFGRPYIVATEGCIHDGWLMLSPRKSNVDNDFMYHLLGSPFVYSEFSRLAAGATVKNLNIDLVSRVEVPFPPLAEQRRIAAVLDQADDLRRKRRKAIEQLDGLTQAMFINTFGDPLINPRGWQMEALGNLSYKFSDGPFGSNLKSEHYVEKGVRVIRLQNIGVGRFIDDDQAYISEEHFQKLRKHACHPGDVLIGTLGDPNLRACVHPDNVPIALNKADCVQMICNLRRCVPEYIVALLNCPSTEPAPV